MRLAKILLTIAALMPAAADLAFGQTQRANVDEAWVTTYFRDKTIRVELLADEDFHGVTGHAKVELKDRGVVNIEASFKGLHPIRELPGLYSTYVLWAILDNGSAYPLGPVRSESDSRFDRDFNAPFTISSSFALLLTAEPHQRVSKPSKAIVLRSSKPVGENAERAGSAKVTYAVSENDYFAQRPKPDKKKKDKAYEEFRRTPLAVLSARYAVILARRAEAETLAPEKYTIADEALQEVNSLVKQRAKLEEIETKATFVTEAAASAEKLALEVGREKRDEQEKESAASERSSIEDDLKQTKRELAAKKEETDDLKRQLGALNIEFDDKKSQAIQDARRAADAEQRLSAANQELQKLKLENQALNMIIERLRAVSEFTEARPNLEAFLKSYGTVASRENSLVLTLNELYWTAPDLETLADTFFEKLQVFSRKMAESKFLKVKVDSIVAAAEDDTSAALAFAETRQRALVKLLQDAGVETGRLTAPGAWTTPLPPSKKKPARRGKIEIEISSNSK